MLVTSVSTATTPPSANADGAKTAVGAAPDPTAGTPAADSVTLSAEAQQTLSSGQPPPATVATTPSSDAIDAAVAALNDTSGKTSVADQLQALALISNLVATSSTVATSTGHAPDISAGVALFDSPFANHATDLFNTISNMKAYYGSMASDYGDRFANSIDDALGAFIAMSVDDQQTLVGTTAIQQKMMGDAAPITTVAGYQANQQAQADVIRAIAAAEANPAYAATIGTNESGGANDFGGKRDAMGKLAAAAGDQATVDLVKLSQTPANTDAWTQAAQAYFAKYGPPPAPVATPGPPAANPNPPPAGYQPPDGKTLIAALSAVNDTSGETPLQPQTDAWNTLLDYAKWGHQTGPDASVLMAWGVSPFETKVSNLQDAMGAGLNPNSDVPKAQLDRLNRLSVADQQAYFATSNRDDSGGTRFASLDSMKANFSTRSSIDNLYDQVLTSYGLDPGDQVTDPKLLNNAAFKTLNGLRWGQDQAYDSWTTQAQSFLAGLKPGDFGQPAAGAKPQSTKDANAAKALATLKQVSDTQWRSIQAERALRMGHKPAPPPAGTATAPAGTAPAGTAPVGTAPVGTGANAYAPGDAVNTYA
jgi:hypothetical protein